MDRDAKQAMAHGVAKESQLSSWAQQADIRVFGKAAVLIGAWGPPSSIELMAAVTPSSAWVQSLVTCWLSAKDWVLFLEAPPVSLPCGPHVQFTVWICLFFFPTTQVMSLWLPPPLQTATEAVTICPIADPNRIIKGETAHHIRRFYPPQGSSLLGGHLGVLPTAQGKAALGHCEGHRVRAVRERLTAEIWLHNAESIANATDLYILRWLKWQVILLFYHNFS